VTQGGKRNIARLCECTRPQKQDDGTVREIRGRRPPIMVFSETVALLTAAMDRATLERLSHLALQDYKCPKCRKVVLMTVGDVLGAP